MASQKKPRVERRPIQSRRKKSKGPLVLVLLLVVGGGVAGLWKAGMLGDVKEEIAKQADKAGKAIQQATGSSGGGSGGGKASPSGTGGTGDPGTGTDPGSGTGTDPGTTTRRVDPEDTRRAEAAQTVARQHIAAGRFTEAMSALDDVLQSSPAISVGTESALKSVRKRAFNHHVISKGFQLDQRLAGDTTVLTMVDGRRIEVRITGERDGFVHCVWKGIKTKFKTSTVLKRTVIPADQLAMRDMDQYRKILAEVSKKGPKKHMVAGPRAYLVVVKYCVERNLRPQIAEVVQAAESSTPSFFRDLFETKAAILYQRYLALSKSGNRNAKSVFEKIQSDYPDTAVAQEMRSVGQGRPPEAAQAEEVAQRIEKRLAPKPTRTSNAGAKGWLSKGDAQYARAMKEYRQGFPGQPNADRHNKVAWNMFKEAQKYYEKAFEADPRNEAIEDKIALCQREIYSCQKQMKIH